jgi:hypothetical protein
MAKDMASITAPKIPIRATPVPGGWFNCRECNSESVAVIGEAAP